MVLRKTTYPKLRLAHKAGPALCLFYLIGICNGLVLEVLHETSHLVSSQSHTHSFMEHRTADRATLEALAGHSHETLELLKDLLEAQSDGDQEQEQPFHFKLDRHVPEKTDIALYSYSEIESAPPGRLISLTSLWAGAIPTPPPQVS